MPAPSNVTVLPLSVQLVSVAVPSLNRPPPYWAEVPLSRQPLSITAPELFTPPPWSTAEPPVIVRPESDAATSRSTWNTLPALVVLTLSRPAPGPVIVVGSAVLLNSSVPCDSVIVAGALPRLKSIVLGVVARSACCTAQRRGPLLQSSAVTVAWK